MAETEFGKVAEQRIKTWLDRPELGYDFNRIPDQMSGYYMVSRNICDFDCYKFPYHYYIESKCTYSNRLDFSRLTDVQRNGLRVKAEIPGVFGLVIVLFATYRRAFVFDITDIVGLDDLTSKTTSLKIKSVNITKLDKWTIPYKEIATVPSRKSLLDYTGALEDYLPNKQRWLEFIASET